MHTESIIPIRMISGWHISEVIQTVTRKCEKCRCKYSENQRRKTNWPSKYLQYKYHLQATCRGAVVTGAWRAAAPRRALRILRWGGRWDLWHRSPPSHRPGNTRSCCGSGLTGFIGYPGFTDFYGLGELYLRSSMKVYGFYGMWRLWISWFLRALPVNFIWKTILQVLRVSRFFFRGFADCGGLQMLQRWWFCN